MKNYILLLLLFLIFTGCNKNFDSVIEPQDSGIEFNIIELSAPDTFTVSQNQVDTLSVSLTLFSNVTPPPIYTYLKKGNLTLASSQMNISGNQSNNTFTYYGELTLNDYSRTGFSSLFFVAEGKIIATSNIFITGVNNPPVVSDLSMPDTVSINEEFVFNIKVNDEDGVGDIAGVYYNVYTPQGNIVINSQGISDFPLSDNGDTSISGDEVANDQIYTMKLTFPQGSEIGVWQFKFFALDRARDRSNIITHNLTVTE